MLSENLCYKVKFVLTVLTEFFPLLSAGGMVLGTRFIYITCNESRSLGKVVLLSSAMKESVVFPFDKVESDERKAGETRST